MYKVVIKYKSIMGKLPKTEKIFDYYKAVERINEILEKNEHTIESIKLKMK